MPDEASIRAILDEDHAQLSEKEQREQPSEFTFYDEAGKPFASRMRGDIPERLQSGQIKLHADETIMMQMPDGSTKMVAGSLVQRVIDEKGFALDETGQRRGKYGEVRKEAYEGRPVLSAAMGLASSATLGAFDVAARAMGKEEVVQQVQEYEPGASLGGQVVGYFTPGGAARGVTKGIAKLTAKAAGKKTVAKAGIHTIAGVAEGGAIGVHGGIRDTALSDNPVTAEALAAISGNTQR